MSKFTSFVKKNGKKIAIGVGLIALAGTAGYFGYKYVDDTNYKLFKLSTDNELLNNKIVMLSDTNIKLAEDNRTLMEACSEGLFEEGIATVTRKMNSAKDRVEVILKEIEYNPNNKQLESSLHTYITKMNLMAVRKMKFNEAQRVYELSIENLDD